MKPPAFAELPNQWTPVFPSTTLTAAPVPFTLAGERLVFFRSASGPAAVLEQCPHRGVSLALGQVVDGCLACPFHGWRFGADGACTHVPFNPGVATDRLRTHAIPVQEAAGLIWAYTGEAPTSTPILPALASHPSARFGYVWEDWNTHWTRVMENMLDTPHLPFVHKGTIGAGMARRLGPTTKMEQTLTETPAGFDIHYRLDGDPSEALLQWVRPNGMVLHILDKPGRTLRMHVGCIPLAPPGCPRRRTRRTSRPTRRRSGSAPGTTTPSCRASPDDEPTVATTPPVARDAPPPPGGPRT